MQLTNDLRVLQLNIRDTTSGSRGLCSEATRARTRLVPLIRVLYYLIAILQLVAGLRAQSPIAIILDKYKQKICKILVPGIFDEKCNLIGYGFGCTYFWRVFLVSFLIIYIYAYYYTYIIFYMPGRMELFVESGFTASRAV